MTIGGGKITVACGLLTPRTGLSGPASAWDSVEVDEPSEPEPILPAALHAKCPTLRRSLPSQVTNQKPHIERIAAFAVRALLHCSSTTGGISHDNA